MPVRMSSNKYEILAIKLTKQSMAAAIISAISQRQQYLLGNLREYFSTDADMQRDLP